MPEVLLSVGSNLGDRQAHLRAAVDRLSTQVAVQGVSSLYETTPVGYLEQPSFLNAVVVAEASLPASDLLRTVKSIETELGRSSSVRWGPREIDVDILSYDDQVLDTIDLQLPHPRLVERAFVLVPLAEIAPLWRHPSLGLTATELLAALPATAGVALYQSDWWPE